MKTGWMKLLVSALLIIASALIASAQADDAEDDEILGTPTPVVSLVIVPEALLRAGPDQRFVTVGSLVEGSPLVPFNISADGQWVLVLYRGGFGWVRRDLGFWVDDIDALPILPDEGLTPTPPPTEDAFIPFASPTPSGNYVATTANVLVRTGPGIGFPRLGRLIPGQTVEAVSIDESGNWILIRYTDVSPTVSAFGATVEPSFDGFGWVARPLVFWDDDIDALPVITADNLTPSPTPTETLTPTASNTPTATPTASNTLTPTASVTATQTATLTTTVTPTDEPSPTATQTATLTTTATPTDEPSPTVTASATATHTATLTETTTPTASATATPTDEPTATPTHTETTTPTDEPTATHTVTATETATPTDEPSPTATASATVTETATPTDAPVVAIVPTDTSTPQPSPTDEPSPTATASATASATHTQTATATASATHTQTATATASATHTQTATATASATSTDEPTLTATATASLTPTATQTPTDAPPALIEISGGDDGGVFGQAIPPELLIGGVLLALIALYAALYLRGQFAGERYAGGFVIADCPVCQRGKLKVETRAGRLLGIPNNRHIVRCDECRSILREVGGRRWRYAVDSLEDEAMYRAYNGKVLTERQIIALDDALARPKNPRRGEGSPAFVDDDTED